MKVLVFNVVWFSGKWKGENLILKNLVCNYVGNSIYNETFFFWENDLQWNLMYLLRKTYQKYIVVEKIEEKGSNENWYPMAYPQKKKRKRYWRKRKSVSYGLMFLCVVLVSKRYGKLNWRKLSTCIGLWLRAKRDTELKKKKAWSLCL